MDKSRIVVILILILIALLFAVGIGAGFFIDDDGSAPKDEAGIKGALTKVPDLITGLGGMLKGMGPRLKAEDLIDVKSHPITVRPGAVLVIHVRASDDDDYRKATFRLIDTGGISGSVEIRYQAECLPPDVDKDSESGRNMKDQKVSLAYPITHLTGEDLCNDEDKACGKLTIFKCGGTLTLSCIGLSACQIELRE